MLGRIIVVAALGVALFRPTSVEAQRAAPRAPQHVRAARTAAFSSPRTDGPTSISATRGGSCSTASRATTRCAISSSAPIRDTRRSRPSCSESSTGSTVPNAYGDLPLIGRDPTKPAVTPGADPASATQYDYWDHVDFIVREAERRGLHVAMLPTWGRWVINPQSPTDVVFDETERRSVRTIRRPAIQGPPDHLGARRRPPHRRRGEGLARHGARDRDRHERPRGLLARDDDVPSVRRVHVVHGVPRRSVARLQHAADQPRARAADSQLGEDRGGLRAHTGEAGRRRRAALRGSSARLPRRAERLLVRRPRPATRVLGRLRRRGGDHLRQSRRVAVLRTGPSADQRTTDVLDRGDPPAGCGAASASEAADGVAPVFLARSRPVARRRHAGRRRSPAGHARRRLPVRVQRAGAPVRSRDGKDLRGHGRRVVVQSAQRRRDADRPVREYRRAHLHARRRRASDRTGCWWRTTRAGGSALRVGRRHARGGALTPR